MKVNLEVYLSVLGNMKECYLQCCIIILRSELLCKCTFKRILFNVFTIYVMLKKIEDPLQRANYFDTPPPPKQKNNNKNKYYKKSSPVIC